ncbi:MAG: GIY-YIG nuclease family protein [Deltaproteobacteria bacterium]|nr:GIY-YIG nuclease family protein [Deltaproteobacteria bacterium]
MEDKFGYQQDIKNGDGIIRARTTGGHLRSWDIPRTLKALEVVKKEWGNLEYPGVYILFDAGGKKVYIGEAKDICNRLKTHMATPEDKIKD